MTASDEPTSAGSRAGLILSKLQVPTARAGMVRRGSVLRRVMGAGGPPLVSVVAPGGYGKTTLLAQWAGESPRAFAWVTVDRDDNDVVLLVREIDAALRASGALGPAATRRDSRSLRTAVQRLRAEISSTDAPFVLVLDDVHELTSVDAREFVSSLVRSLPAGSQLVLAGRVEMADIVAAARASRNVLELGLPDVALDNDESYALLANLDESFPADVADAYVQRAEGWAAGLYLLALSGVDAPEGAPAGERYVSDYLWAQHLATLPEEQLRFLARTSVLDRLSGPLCDSVLDSQGSADLLTRIATSSPFLVPFDRAGGWYRYHDLFREVLVRNLTKTDAAAARESRQRAAAWCLANGLPESAMSYALAAGDEDMIARIVLTAGFPLFRTGQFATVEGWLSEIDDGPFLARHPEVAVVGAIAQALLERPFHAERWQEIATKALPTAAPPPDGSESLEAWVSVCEAFLCRHGPERMLEDAERGISGLSPASPLRGIALMVRLIALRLLGRPDLDDQTTDAAEAAEAAGATFAAIVNHCELTLMALERRDLEAAQTAQARFAFAIEDGAYTDYKSIALPLVVTARLRIAQGRRDEAVRVLAAAQQIRPLLTHAIPYVNLQVLVEKATAYVELGEMAAARAVLSDADEIVRRRPQLGVLRDELEAVRARANASRASDGWENSLTAAELRLLPLFTTHLSFPEIGERLFVSRHTVKTQSMSIYRKLGVSSRSEAVERAAELGLIDPDTVRTG